jgi:hypothetical protein
MHAVLHGVSRDQFMAQHKANHIQVVYCDDAESADLTLQVKAAMADALGIRVNICGVHNALNRALPSGVAKPAVVARN